MAFPLENFLSGKFFGNTLLQYLVFFGIIIISILLGKVAYYFSKTILRAYAKKSKSMIDDIMIEVTEMPLILFIVIIGFYFGFKQLTLSKDAEAVFIIITKNLFTIALGWFIVRLVESIIVHYLTPLASKTETDLDDHLIPLLQKLARYTLITIILLIMLSNLGINVAAGLAGLGIGGLAIALAAQELLKNILGGVAILTDKPFKLNEWVEIDTYQGTVVEIGLRSTRLKTTTGEFVTIPNSIIATTPTVNYLRFPTRKITFVLGLTYDTSPEKIEKAKKLVRSLLDATEHVVKDTIDICFIQLNTYSLDLDVRFDVDTNNGVMIRQIKDSVNMRIMKEFAKEKISFAYPTQTLEIKK